uniref:Uncharacterized protein n=1 Tax=Rhizophora mucronata TaxID=61149 RepID=A0A2P2NV99_RHIMU
MASLRILFPSVYLG